MAYRQDETQALNAVGTGSVLAYLPDDGLLRHLIDRCEDLEVHRDDAAALRSRHRHGVKFRKPRRPLNSDYGRWDAIVCVGPLERGEFRDADATLACLSPHLRHGGVLVCSVRLLNHMSMSRLLPEQFALRGPNEWRTPDGLTALPEEGLRRSLARRRLQPLDPVGYGSWPDGHLDLLVARKV